MGPINDERNYFRSKAISQDELNRLDHEAIGRYLHQCESNPADITQLTPEEQRRLELNKTKVYNVDHIFSFINVETRERHSFMYKDASDMLLSLIYKVYVTHTDLSMLDLYHTFIRIYPGAKTITLHVMDATELDIEQLDEGKRYPYLLRKLRTLFDPIKFVSYRELSEKRRQLRELFT